MGMSSYCYEVAKQLTEVSVAFISDDELCECEALAEQIAATISQNKRYKEILDQLNRGPDNLKELKKKMKSSGLKTFPEGIE